MVLLITVFILRNSEIRVEVVRTMSKHFHILLIVQTICDLSLCDKLLCAK